MATMSSPTAERRFTPDRRSSTRTTSAQKMNAIDWIAMVLLIVGGVNWGLIGLFGFDLVATLFGPMSLISRLVYTLVGLSALYSIYTSTKLAHGPGR